MMLSATLDYGLGQSALYSFQMSGTATSLFLFFPSFLSLYHISEMHELRLGPP